MRDASSYVGSELELFREARNWKLYLRQQLAPFIGGDVLEVGAGIGGTTAALHGSCQSWTCLEPDAKLVDQLKNAVQLLSPLIGAMPSVQLGTLEQLPATRSFDSILYVDVLEHIEDDRAELERAASRLRPGGYLVSASPAHNWLFSPFDQSIGHHRRYNRASLSAVAPPSLTLVHMRYLDVVGIVASLGNRLMARSPMPTKRQIRVWDRWMVPISRRLDSRMRYAFGKTLVGIWECPDPAPSRG